jgi:hypothetical protein
MCVRTSSLVCFHARTDAHTHTHKGARKPTPVRLRTRGVVRTSVYYHRQPWRYRRSSMASRSLLLCSGTTAILDGWGAPKFAVSEDAFVDAVDSERARCPRAPTLRTSIYVCRGTCRLSHARRAVARETVAAAHARVVRCSFPATLLFRLSAPLRQILGQIFPTIY